MPNTKVTTVLRCRNSEEERYVRQVRKQMLAVTFNCVSLCGSRDVVIQISFPSDIVEKPALDHPSVKMEIIVPFIRLIVRI